MKNSLRNTAQIYLKVNRKDIAYISSVISCYDGLALMRTKDPFLAVIEWQVSPDFVDDAHKLINALKKEIEIEIVEWDGYS
jgi:hypothetical protein